MRNAAAVIVALALAAVLVLAAAALRNDRQQAFTLGVARARAIAVKAHQEACQSPITVPEGAAFNGVTLAVGTEQRPGPRLDVFVRAADPEQPAGADVLARGSLAAGYPDVDRAPQHTVSTDEVAAGRTVAVCFANRGRRRAFIYGDVDAAARASSAFVDEAPAGLDLALDFERRPSRSLAGLVPNMLERAALFRPHLIGAWTYVVLALLVLLAVPALLVRALRAAERGAA